MPVPVRPIFRNHCLDMGKHSQRIALVDQLLEVLYPALHEAASRAWSAENFNLFVTGGLHVLPFPPELLVKFLAGPQTHESDLDIDTRFMPGEPNHVVGEIDNPNWLT